METFVHCKNKSGQTMTGLSTEIRRQAPDQPPEPRTHQRRPELRRVYLLRKPYGGRRAPLAVEQKCLNPWDRPESYRMGRDLSG